MVSAEHKDNLIPLKDRHKKLDLIKVKYFSSCQKFIQAQTGRLYTAENLQFLVKKLANPKLTMFGRVMLAENELSLSIYRKVNSLYNSMLDARTVLLRYRSDLSNAVGVENDCITPFVASRELPMVFYKREDLTSIKAYKIRGAIYQMSKIIEKNHSKQVRFIAASTGNHALGVFKSAEILKVPRVTICISESVTELKKKRLEKRVNELLSKGINAELVVHGQTFDQTNHYAKELVVSDPNNYFIDPYNTHNTVGGQGTIGLELLQQFENQFFDYERLEVDAAKLAKIERLTVIVPIGGGGLISGTAIGLKMGIANYPRLKHLKVNVIGVRLRDLDSKYGDAIKVKVIGDHNIDLIRNVVDKQVLITDMDMQRGVNFILKDIKVKVEGASAGSMKPIFENIVIPSENHAVICLLSGGNTTV